VSRGGFRSVALAVAWRAIHNVFTNPVLLLPSLLFPLIFFAGFAGGLSKVSKVPGFDFPTGYTAFQFVFVLLQSAAFGGVFTGFAIARDFEYGFARRLMLASPDRRGIVAGYAISAAVRWAATIAVVTVVALVAGMHVDGNTADLVALYTLALIVNVASLLWACGIAMRMRTVQAGALMQSPVFLVLFLAPVYVPLNLLSGTIHAIAVVNPATRLLDAGRGLISGRPSETLLAFGLAGGLAVAFALWAVRGLRRAEAAG